MNLATSSAARFCRPLMNVSKASFSECINDSLEENDAVRTLSSRSLKSKSSATRLFSCSASPTIAVPTRFMYAAKAALSFGKASTRP